MEDEAEIILEADKIEFVSNGGDAGAVYEICCPKCGDKVRVAQGGWWKQACQCGYEWRIVCIGEKRES